MRFAAVSIWVLLATAVLAAAPAAAAQDSIPYPAGNNLSVKVKAVATALGGDTIRMNYTLYNDSTSVQKPELFLVRTEAKAIGHVGSPGMKLGWMASVGVLQDSASIQWFAVGDRALTAPGDSAAPFHFSAVGLVGITRFYVQGFVPLQEYTADAERTAAPLTIWEDSYKGWTIAVERLPREMSVQALAGRLVALANAACLDHFLWVTDDHICSSPNAEQRRALQAIRSGNLITACARLRDFADRVERLPHKTITTEGRSLLRLNALHFTRSHCAQGSRQALASPVGSTISWMFPATSQSRF